MPFVYTQEDVAGRLHPVAAGLIAMAAFALWSAALNGLWPWLVRTLPGDDRFVNAIILVLGLYLGATAVGAGAAASRSHRDAVIVAAVLGLGALYLAAWRYRVGFVTGWLYPHWPWTHPPFSTWAIVAFVIGLGCFGAAALQRLIGAITVRTWRPPRRRGRRVRGGRIGTMTPARILRTAGGAATMTRTTSTTIPDATPRSSPPPTGPSSAESPPPPRGRHRPSCPARSKCAQPTHKRRSGATRAVRGSLGPRAQGKAFPSRHSCQPRPSG